jgi:2-haloacid dehalogenase
MRWRCFLGLSIARPCPYDPTGPGNPRETSLHSVYVFDAYGTLFDTGAAVARLAGEIGEDGRLLADIWRRKQLEYSWVRSLMGGAHRNFWDLTEDALDYAFQKVPTADPSLRGRLLEAYRDLDTFEEVPSTLRALRDRGARLAILSNGSRDMLARAVRSAGLDDVFDIVFSAEDCGTYKAAPAMYDLVTTHFRLYPDAVSFQSSNRWDIAGAAAFGFHTVWINRGGEPDEYLDLQPGGVLPDLRDLPKLV